MKPIGRILVTVTLVGGLVAANRIRAQEATHQEPKADNKQVPEVVDSGQPDGVDGQAYLGVGVAPMHPALVAQLPEVAGKGRGILVEQVVANSPAERAGLKRYDLLVQFDNQDLYSPEQLVKLVRNAEPNREATLQYVRGGQLHEATVTLGEQPARASAQSRRMFRMPFADRWNWVQPPANRVPGLDIPRLNIPGWHGSGPQAGNQTSWQQFQSLNIVRQRDGSYQLRFQYRDADDKTIERVFEGTRDQIVEAIRNDKELPEDQRNHLIQSLNQVENPMIGIPRVPMQFPMFDEWERELFNWPHLDF